MKLTLITALLLPSLASSAILLDLTGLTSTTGGAPNDIYTGTHTFDISSLDPTLAGVTVTIGVSGPTDSTGLTNGSRFNNENAGGSGSNLITLTFSQALNFQVDMVTNHFVTAAVGGRSETNILTMTGGTWDNGSYAITGGTTPGPVTAFTSGDSVFTAGPLSTDGGNHAGSAQQVEWEVEGTGTGFSFSHEYIGNGTATNAFTVCITDVIPVPEPSSTALLGLGGLALFSRRKR